MAPDANIIELDIRRSSVYERAQALGVEQIPAVAINGRLMPHTDEE